MINIDDRFLTNADESELFLMVWIARYMGKENFSFPSNTTLCEKTGWDIKKLRRVKASCIEKGFLSTFRRYRPDGGETSPGYKIETDYLSVFINLKGRGETTPPSQNGTTKEVLKEEVLKDERETPAKPAELTLSPENGFSIMDKIEKYKQEFPNRPPVEYRILACYDAVMDQFERYPMYINTVLALVPPDSPPSKKQFREEVMKWIRHNSDNPAFLSDPVKYMPKTLPSWFQRWHDYSKSPGIKQHENKAVYVRPKDVY